MNRDLGVWTYQDCALVLIDFLDRFGVGLLVRRHQQFLGLPAV
jgi:hypothetical protein